MPPEDQKRPFHENAPRTTSIDQDAFRRGVDEVLLLKPLRKALGDLLAWMKK